jgi:hypothetical protein
MVGGHTCCGVIRDDLLLRVGAEAADAPLDEPHGLFIPYDPVCPYVLGVAPLVGSQAEQHRSWCDHCQLVALLTSPLLDSDCEATGGR